MKTIRVHWFSKIITVRVTEETERYYKVSVLLPGAKKATHWTIGKNSKSIVRTRRKKK